MSLFKYHDFGLTPEEVDALVGVANKNTSLTKELLSEYEFSDRGHCLTGLNKAASKKNISNDDVYKLLMARDVSLHPSIFIEKYRFNEEMKNGYYLKHASFGCVTHKLISSSHPTFVGTPTMDSQETGLEFSRAELKMEYFKEEPRLSDGKALFEILLSSEQFAGLIREQKSESPCAISRLEMSFLDIPPRLVETVSIAKMAKERAIGIGRPLTEACAALREFLKNKEKISTKADYAELREMAQRVKEAMMAIKEPMNALLAETAGLLAEASTKQMLEEIAEPLKSIGMDSSEIFQLIHKHDH